MQCRLLVKSKVTFIYYVLLVLALSNSAQADEVGFEELLKSSERTSFVDQPEVSVILELANENSWLNSRSRLTLSGMEEFNNMNSQLDIDFEITNTIGRLDDVRWSLKTASIFSLSSGSSRSANVDEAFVDYNPGPWFVSLGKRRVNWGHSFAFNPVNVVIPPPDPLNPDPVSEGRPMLWFQLGSDRVTVDAILTRNYDLNWKSDADQWGLSFNINWTYFDTSFYYFDGQKTSTGDNYPRLLGTSFSYDVGAGVVLYGELASFSENSRNYYSDSGERIRLDNAPVQQYVLGVNRTYGSNNSFYLEYYYNGMGYDNKYRDNYFNALDQGSNASDINQLNADFRDFSMSNKYIAGGYEKQFNNNTTISFGSVYSSDLSYAFQFSGLYDYSTQTTITAEFVIKEGSRDSEFGNSYYSQSVSLDIQYHY